MRKILLLFCFVLAAAGVRADNKPDAKKCEMSFTTTEHNFGKIPERGKAVSHTFEFRNDGEHPIVVTRVSTSCKCTTYSFSKRPVPPGGTGKITVTYNPKKQPEAGVFYKVVQVFTNCSAGRVMLTIRGEIVARESDK